MIRTFDCPFCGGLVSTNKAYGVARCPDCERTMGIGDLLINQTILDRERSEEQKYEIAAENAWLRVAENHWEGGEG